MLFVLMTNAAYKRGLALLAAGLAAGVVVVGFHSGSAAKGLRGKSTPVMGDSDVKLQQMRAGRGDMASTWGVAPSVPEEGLPSEDAAAHHALVGNESSPARGNEFARTAGEIDRRREAAEDVNTQRLLEAGSSQERIDWLRRRRDELKALQDRANVEGRQTVPSACLTIVNLKHCHVLILGTGSPWSKCCATDRQLW